MTFSLWYARLNSTWNFMKFKLFETKIYECCAAHFEIFPIPIFTTLYKLTVSAFYFEYRALLERVNS